MPVQTAILRAMTKARETDLYLPLKAFLEGQGYLVKSEIGPADVVARRGEEPPVIVELKLGFSLALFHQAVVRRTICDAVYVAVPRGTGRGFQKSLLENRKLCRLLGLGLLTVRLKDGLVEAHLDPGPYAPRKSPARAARLLREFEKREGDPNLGGTRGGVMTAYRQDAIKCAAYLAENGPTKGAGVAKATGVARATRMMADNHYGWFERVEKGVYGLSEVGRAEIDGSDI